MKRFLKTSASFFAFTKGERRGIVSLLGILTFLMMGIQVMPYYYSKPLDLEFSDEILVESSSNWSENNRANNGDDTPVGAGFISTSLNDRPALSTNNSINPQEEQSQASNWLINRRERAAFTVQANTCDTLDLQQIRGIGSATSQRIIRYREQLGGFVRKEQLMEVWGIDSARFVQIESAFIIDKENIRKLNINTASIRDLQRHPYLDYYQAKAIVQTRDNQGLYKNITDILKIALIDQKTFDLIRDYLEL
jgi:competence ComEA-like helix-hairpin-helix protein